MSRTGHLCSPFTEPRLPGTPSSRHPSRHLPERPCAPRPGGPLTRLPGRATVARKEPRGTHRRRGEAACVAAFREHSGARQGPRAGVRPPRLQAAGRPVSRAPPRRRGPRGRPSSDPAAPPHASLPLLPPLGAATGHSSPTGKVPSPRARPPPRHSLPPFARGHFAGSPPPPLRASSKRLPRAPRLRPAGPSPSPHAGRLGRFGPPDAPAAPTSPRKRRAPPPANRPQPRAASTARTRSGSRGTRRPLPSSTLRPTEAKSASNPRPGLVPATPPRPPPRPAPNPSRQLP